MTNSPFRLVLVVLLIAVNGFFAAAEVSLVSVRQSRLRQMVEQGQAGAQVALSLLANPGRLLSVTQVGVTLASLGLGWVGEDAVYQILSSWTRRLPLFPGSASLLHALSFVGAFLVISYFHVVLGEVVPKNIAIARADRLAALMAPALLLFYRATIAFVVTIERSATFMTRMLKLQSGSHAGGHSAEELKLIVSSSRGLGIVPESEEEIIHRVLDLSAILVREVMVARNDMVSLPADASLDQVLETMVDRRHSRLPVYQKTPEKIIGILHYKDLLPLWEERRQAIRSGRSSRAFNLARLLRKHIVVPETKPLSQMLDEFRKARLHMAMVVDEFGTIVGLITVKDVLQQVTGRFEDEHVGKTVPRLIEADEIELDGATRVLDLDSEFGLGLPTDAGFETLAGFLLYEWGEIPKVGEWLDFQGRRFTVVAMDRNRIARVRIEKLPRELAEPRAGSQQ
ncbi:MAG: HlyC/CorC family transporter [Acidobacteriia bacterium]|nr:HlyC/CorC family transporter [Terriglobia bacterium]